MIFYAIFWDARTLPSKPEPGAVILSLLILDRFVVMYSFVTMNIKYMTFFRCFLC